MQAGSPTPRVPKSITALSRPSRSANYPHQVGVQHTWPSHPTRMALSTLRHASVHEAANWAMLARLASTTSTAAAIGADRRQVDACTA